MTIEKEDRLLVVDVTILDILQGTTKHLMINVMENREEIYLYVSYVINLDTQKDFVEWIEET